MSQGTLPWVSYLPFHQLCLSPYPCDQKSPPEWTFHHNVCILKLIKFDKVLFWVWLIKLKCKVFSSTITTRKCCLGIHGKFSKSIYLSPLDILRVFKLCVCNRLRTARLQSESVGSDTAVRPSVRRTSKLWLWARDGHRNKFCQQPGTKF